MVLLGEELANERVRLVQFLVELSSIIQSEYYFPSQKIDTLSFQKLSTIERELPKVLRSTSASSARNSKTSQYRQVQFFVDKSKLYLTQYRNFLKLLLESGNLQVQFETNEVLHEYFKKVQTSSFWENFKHRFSYSEFSSLSKAQKTILATLHTFYFSRRKIVVLIANHELEKLKSLFDDIETYETQNPEIQTACDTLFVRAVHEVAPSFLYLIRLLTEGSFVQQYHEPHYTELLASKKKDIESGVLYDYDVFIEEFSNFFGFLFSNMGNIDGDSEIERYERLKESHAEQVNAYFAKDVNKKASFENHYLLLKALTSCVKNSYEDLVSIGENSGFKMIQKALEKIQEKLTSTLNAQPPMSGDVKKYVVSSFLKFAEKLSELRGDHDWQYFKDEKLLDALNILKTFLNRNGADLTLGFSGEQDAQVASFSEVVDEIKKSIEEHESKGSESDEDEDSASKSLGYLKDWVEALKTDCLLASVKFFQSDIKSHYEKYEKEENSLSETGKREWGALKTIVETNLKNWPSLTVQYNSDLVQDKGVKKYLTTISQSISNCVSNTTNVRKKNVVDTFTSYPSKDKDKIFVTVSFNNNSKTFSLQEIGTIFKDHCQGILEENPPGFFHKFGIRKRISKPFLYPYLQQIAGLINKALSSTSSESTSAQPTPTPAETAPSASIQTETAPSEIDSKASSGSSEPSQQKDKTSTTLVSEEALKKLNKLRNLVNAIVKNLNSTNDSVIKTIRTQLYLESRASPLVPFLIVFEKLKVTFPFLDKVYLLVEELCEQFKKEELTGENWNLIGTVCKTLQDEIGTLLGPQNLTSKGQATKSEIPTPDHQDAKSTGKVTSGDETTGGKAVQDDLFDESSEDKTTFKYHLIEFISKLNRWCISQKSGKLGSLHQDMLMQTSGVQVIYYISILESSQIDDSVKTKVWNFLREIQQLVGKQDVIKNIPMPYREISVKCLSFLNGFLASEEANVLETIPMPQAKKPAQETQPLEPKQKVPAQEEKKKYTEPSFQDYKHFTQNENEWLKRMNPLSSLPKYIQVHTELVSYLSNEANKNKSDDQVISDCNNILSQLTDEEKQRVKILKDYVNKNPQFTYQNMSNSDIGTCLEELEVIISNPNSVLIIGLLFRVCRVAEDKTIQVSAEIERTKTLTERVLNLTEELNKKQKTLEVAQKEVEKIKAEKEKIVGENKQRIDELNGQIEKLEKSQAQIPQGIEAQLKPLLDTLKSNQEGFVRVIGELNQSLHKLTAKVEKPKKAADSIIQKIINPHDEVLGLISTLRILLSSLQTQSREMNISINSIFSSLGFGIEPQKLLPQFKNAIEKRGLSFSGTSVGELNFVKIPASKAGTLANVYEKLVKALKNMKAESQLNSLGTCAFFVDKSKKFGVCKYSDNVMHVIGSDEYTHLATILQEFSQEQVIKPNLQQKISDCIDYLTALGVTIENALNELQTVENFLKKN